MKGTFFSADFVTDKDNNYRLIEINTDTGIVESQASIFDWSDFIDVLSANNITEVEVVYKYDIQHPIVNHLSSSLALNAPFITTFTKTVVPADSIFPPSPSDSASKFILRMAYDESAILDSEYAKGTLNLLTLFANNGDSGSITNFYHSSSYNGYYNTLDTTQFNGTNLPDAVSKTVIELHTPHKFWKIGHSESGSLDRYNDFIQTTATSDDIIQQYHISPSQISNGVVTSTRSFCIVYGPNLDLCYTAEYEIDSVLDLPTGSIAFDDSVVNNLLESKHYYEFATNTIKNTSHGVLENQSILDINNEPVEVKDMVIGNSYLSYFIEGSPNTDDYEVLRQWSYTGNTLPSGSYMTSSVLIGLYEDTTYANDATEIIFDNGNTVVVGGEARMLVHNKNTNVASYQRVVDLSTDYSIFGSNETTSSISEINLIIYDEQQPLYTMNMEDVDNFILASGNFVSFFVVHNLVGGSCFVAGTKVLMADGTEKNIEDVVVGDVVLSFNEETLQNEPKKVIGLKTPIHDDLVTYHFANQTSVTSTFDHPYYINGSDLASFAPYLTNKRYEIGKEVKQIKVGDMVSLPTNGSKTAIRLIEELPAVETQTYIITVEDNHNFYANNILVHNK
jgi:hypothetical protein